MIDKYTILNATQNGLNVFKHYIPFEFRLGKNFKNPFYDDKNASCNIYYDRHNQCFKIKDFGNEEYSGDCFSFVAKIHNLEVRSNFLEILHIINQDLHLHLEESLQITNHHENYKRIIDHKKAYVPEEINNSPGKKTYHFTEKPFSYGELKYWQKFDITERILLHYSVKPLSVFQSVNRDNNFYELRATGDEPIFGYTGEGFIKLYRPKSKIRFLYGGHIPKKYCFGLKQLPNRGDILFITGGEKDVMSLYSKGFHAICFNSETSHIPTEIIEMLMHRFKHIILLYDVDKTGLSASEQHCKKLSQYGVKQLLLPLSGSKQEKDISDYFAKGNSRNDLQLLILNLYNQNNDIIKNLRRGFP